MSKFINTDHINKDLLSTAGVIKYILNASGVESAVPNHAGIAHFWKVLHDLPLSLGTLVWLNPSFLAAGKQNWQQQSIFNILCSTPLEVFEYISSNFGLKAP